MKVAVIVPTLNAGEKWIEWVSRVLEQGIPCERILVMDSSSTDDTTKFAENKGIRVVNVKKNDFNHGGTRQLATTFLDDADVLVYLTQDAILKDSVSIANLVKVFEDDSIGAAYGRQLPYLNAGPLESFSRIFNYTGESHIYCRGDISKHGIKAAFLSNSFAAYRVKALNQVHGFPQNVIFGEDMYVAAKMLLDDWSVAYVANACVYHSHDYSPLDDFRRSFDMGVFHNRENWILEKFGKPDSEGVKYIYSEISYLKDNHFLTLIPLAFIKNIFKYTGYKLGKIESILPNNLKILLSSNKSYWVKN